MPPTLAQVLSAASLVSISLFAVLRLPYIGLKSKDLKHSEAQVTRNAAARPEDLHQFGDYQDLKSKISLINNPNISLGYLLKSHNAL